MSDPRTIQSRPLIPGAASGELVVLDDPLSLWGGLDPESGLVIDRLHPQHGERLAGRVVAMPVGRGSSSSSTILAEAVRLGNAPTAVVLREPDHIVVVGALVAEELYGERVPVVVVSDPDYATLMTGERAEIDATGAMVLQSC